jgi:hypothetical protein
MSNARLTDNKRNVNDEFMTLYDDVAAEMVFYTDEFEDKCIYMPCDTEQSAFYRYFLENFKSLKIRKLIASHYEKNESSVIVTVVHRDWDGTPRVCYRRVSCDGDFSSPKLDGLWAESDIIITNPPFSKFRTFYQKIQDNAKKFILVGNMNFSGTALGFDSLQSGRLFVGFTKRDRGWTFEIPDSDMYGDNVIHENGKHYVKLSFCLWFTNLKRPVIEPLVLTKEYSPEAYPEYDNYKAIEVSKVKDIPKDYYGLMGVPVSFIYKWNPSQFELAGHSQECWMHKNPGYCKTPNYKINRIGNCWIDGKILYKRLFIRRRDNNG